MSTVALIDPLSPYMTFPVVSDLSLSECNFSDMNDILALARGGHRFAMLTRRTTRDGSLSWQVITATKHMGMRTVCSLREDWLAGVSKLVHAARSIELFTSTDELMLANWLYCMVTDFGAHVPTITVAQPEDLNRYLIQHGLA